MSTEQLLLLALLIGLPLLERLIQSLRTPKTARPVEQPAPRRREPRIATPPPPPPPLPPQEAPPLPIEVRAPRVAPRPVDAAAARQLRRERQRGPAALPGPTADQRPRRSTRFRRLTGRRALRDGIVLMAVLGPCRALEPPRSAG